MSKKEFDNFLKQQDKIGATKMKINWEATRDEWLSELKLFYNTVENFLKEYIARGKISYEYSNKTIIEDYIGEYLAEVMTIKLGRYQAKLEPIGTNLIGAKGRVDLLGANGKVKFVLVNKTSPGAGIKVYVHGEEPPQEGKDETVIEWVWKIATPPPKIQYIALNQDTFLDALMEAVGG